MADKKSKRKDYLLPDNVNKVSETLNSLILYSKDWDADTVKDKVLKIFSLEKSKLLSACNKDLVSQFESNLKAAFNTNPDEWINTVNDTIDQYRRQADVGLTKAKRDIITLWKKLSINDQVDFDLPWMRHLNLGEKFVDFLNKDERYIFTGFTNQAILGVAIEDSDVTHDSIVISKQDLEKLLLHDFEVDYSSQVPIPTQRSEFISNKLQRQKSLTSIFVPKRTEYWVNDKGVKWKNPINPKSGPTNYDRKVHNLERKVNVNFISQPVWSVSSLKEHFSDTVSKKLDELMNLRNLDSSFIDFEDAESLDHAVDMMIEHQIKTQSLNVMRINSEPCYWPLKDKIALPEKSLYSSPLERYAAWTKELVKSTRHLAGRLPANENGSIDAKKERMIVESTSFLLMKDFEEKLFKQRKDDFVYEWSDTFADYFYTQRDNDDYLDVYNSLLDEKNTQSIFSEMMSGVLTSLQITKTGKVHGQEITPYKRKMALKKNFATLDKVLSSDGNNDLTPKIIKENSTEINKVDLFSLEKAITALNAMHPNSKNLNSYMKEAYEEITHALHDLTGNVQDRLIELMSHMYSVDDSNSPYDLDYNFYTKSALVVLYNELGNHMPKSDGKLSKLIQHKCQGEVLPMIEAYRGNNPSLVIKLNEKKANFMEMEISDLRMKASYCDDEKLKKSEYDEVYRREDLLSKLQEQINNTQVALDKAENYLNRKKEQETEHSMA